MSIKRYTGRIEITEVEQTEVKSKTCRCVGGICHHNTTKTDKQSVQVANIVIRADDLDSLREKLGFHLENL